MHFGRTRCTAPLFLPFLKGALEGSDRKQNICAELKWHMERIAIQEASPTLPLAASLGLTFSYNVTIGIPVYLVIAQNMITAFPVT
jgi:hypothetical protein